MFSDWSGFFVIKGDGFFGGVLVLMQVICEYFYCED